MGPLWITSTEESIHLLYEFLYLFTCSLKLMINWIIFSLVLHNKSGDNILFSISSPRCELVVRLNMISPLMRHGSPKNTATQNRKVRAKVQRLTVSIVTCYCVTHWLYDQNEKLPLAYRRFYTLPRILSPVRQVRIVTDRQTDKARSTTLLIHNIYILYEVEDGAL